MKLNYQRVLIADDEPDHCLIIRLLLKKIWSPGLSFMEAGAGKEAVFLTQQWHPDLILISLQLSEIAGCEVIRKIRALEASSVSAFDATESSQPAWIVAMSTNIRQSERDRAFAAGCNTFLSKPFCIDELFARLPDPSTSLRLLNSDERVICHAA